MADDHASLRIRSVAAQQHGIKQRKDRNAGADTDGEREDAGGGEAGRFHELPGGEAEIGEHGRKGEWGGTQQTVEIRRGAIRLRREELSLAG